MLINLDGEIIGIIAQSYSTEDKDIITALAVSQIKDLIESLSNDEARPYIGIKGQDVTAQISHRTGIPKGVLVTAVQADSPAMLAGMKEYDVVVKIGEDEISQLPAVPGSAGSADAGADCDSHRYAPGSGRIRGGRIRGHSGRDLTQQKRQRKIKKKRRV